MSLRATSDPPEVREIRARQRSWAATKGFELDPNRNRLRDPASALFRGEMSAATRSELEAGAGDELSRIQSLRSSACLVVNVFDPWRPTPQRLGALLGAKVDSLSFEAKQPTGLDGIAPHLDVLLRGPGSTIGIEAKFLELYSPANNAFKDSYFPIQDLKHDLWAGLEGCRRLAERIRNGTEVFEWLAAGQLLKHALGLSKNQSNGFRLVLVWYRVEGLTADDIEEEIGRFARAVSSEFDFTAVTYQDLVARFLAKGREPVPDYFAYLADRYQLSHESHLQLPLITLASSKAVNQKTNLAHTIAGTEVRQVKASYCRTVARAPQRPIVQRRFLVGHDGLGGASGASREKKAAKALYNLRQPLAVGQESVTIVDYEVPLRALQTDRQVGEIDLLGLGAASGRPWIIELKVWPNGDTPLKALFQGLRYSAILDANQRHISSEIAEVTGRQEVVWPGAIAVAADRLYWDQWRGPRTGGGWLEGLRTLAAQITDELGIEVAFLDLDTLDVEVVEGGAQLRSALAIRVL